MRHRLQVISSDFNFPRNQMKAILINVSRYKSDHLACLALSILTQMHCFEGALFCQASEVQLLISRESLVEYRAISSLLPTLRHLLSIDCSIQGQWKILEILEKLTKMCCMPDEDEPHQQNQQLLCNFGQSVKLILIYYIQYFVHAVICKHVLNYYNTDCDYLTTYNDYITKNLNYNVWVTLTVLR